MLEPFVCGVYEIARIFTYVPEATVLCGRHPQAGIDAKDSRVVLSRHVTRCS